MAAATLVRSLHAEPHTFLQPPAALHTSSLEFLKQTLDPIAASIAQTQQQRLQEARKKRKRGQDEADEDVLRLKKVHVDGFAVEQVWEQARRIIDAARKEAQRNFDQLAEKYAIDSSDEESDEDGQEEEGDEEEGSDIGEEGVDWEVEGEDTEGTDEDEEDEEADAEVDDLEESDIEADGDVEMGSDGDEQDDDDDDAAQEFVPDPNGLNDGFFSIDDFNKQSDFFEQADARGDNEEPSDDEEDIDWGSNPLSAAAAAAAKPLQGGGDDDNDDDEDGPTFGNVDLNAPEGFSDDDDNGEQEVEEGEMDGLGSLSNTNAIKYADFFAPPAKKVTRKNKKGRPNPHNFPAVQDPPRGADDAQENEEDMERTISKVHRDLFEDESDNESDPDENLDPADPRSRRSTHERRQAALNEEIRKLEAASVAKREWTLSGEARAADRPVNSLLEEDLEFERVGKPVPVITAEISESLEDLIKRRILAQDFQDLVRRRPDDLATGARRGRLDYELSDAKSKKSLAEMYEEEHLKATDPNYVDAKDEQAQKEQKEIEALWRDISGRLDSLSSWHFKPKAPVQQLDIRVDAPVVRLEDARPAAGADAAAASQLAPQEVYKAGDAVEKADAEVATRGGLPVNREEMSREERKRRRRRDKEREKKANSNVQPAGAKTESKRARERKAVIGDLKKANVKVIGKKGLTNVEGDAIRDDHAPVAGGSYKL